jgi:predicted RNase H-like nuclease
MVSVLAIDAAWTTHEPSGVALVAKDGAGPWRCLCVAPSYAAFLKAADGDSIPWTGPHHGTAPDVRSILASAARLLGGHRVDVVTIDMPVSQKPIKGRRPADNAISTVFGAAQCGTHSPNAARPGKLGEDLTAAFVDAKYEVATVTDKSGTLRRLVEVYPHPALLGLLNETRRLSYKAGKSRKYWPTATVPERIARLLQVHKRILAALSAEIEGIELQLPDASSCTSLASLKRYEDALDALVCAWVGCRYVGNQATPFGDETAAIWVPDVLTVRDVPKGTVSIRTKDAP